MYGNQFQPNTGDAALDESLRELARVFGSTRGDPNWVDGFSCGDSRVTLTKPCWDLTHSDYLDFGWHSVCTNSKDDLRHAVHYLLPRVALDLSRERSWEDRIPWDDWQLISLLLETDWESWPADESKAVRLWFEAWLRHAMKTFRAGKWCSPNVTELANQVGICVPAVFKEMSESHPDAALVWLADQVVNNRDSLLKSGWPEDWSDGRTPWGRFWEDPIRDYQSGVEFTLFLLCDSTHAKLEKAFFEATDLEKQRLFSEACEAIAHVRRFGMTQTGPLAEALASPLLKE